MAGEARAARLVVVPCGKMKVWDRDPGHGPAPARDAYVSTAFRLHVQYAEAAGADWVVLSARHGFLRPGDTVPQDYDVTWSSPGLTPATRAVGAVTLMHQVRQLGLDRYPEVTVLGGADYRAECERAFLGTGCWLEAPFAGLPQGREMAAVKAATAALRAARPAA